jgi:hypothetical protein
VSEGKPRNRNTEYDREWQGMRQRPVAPKEAEVAEAERAPNRVQIGHSGA